jgi:hypothetical protein
MKLYHGTRAAYVPSIEQSGLIPSYEPGADKDFVGRDRWQRKPAVYLTADEDVATAFAKFVANRSGDKPAVLEVNLPDDERGRLQKDEASTNLDAWRFEGRIEPSQIRPGRVTSAPEIGNGNSILSLFAALAASLEKAT